MTAAKLHHIALGIEYLGKNFNGSQYQPQQRTVQSVLESALSNIADEKVAVSFAGRTDSGVHATSQVISFRTDAERQSSAWILGTNSLLPEDVRVHSVQQVDRQFDPRRSARWRRYIYVLGMSPIVPAIEKDLAHWVPFELDAERMDESAQCLIGEQDFTSFRAANCQSLTPFRCVHRISVRRFSELVVLDIIANAFLFRMVRNIASALLGVSRGEVNSLSALLSAKNRSLAPPTAPPMGLYLAQVAYSESRELSLLHTPRLLGPTASLPSFDATDFADVRPTGVN